MQIQLFWHGIKRSPIDLFTFKDGTSLKETILAKYTTLNCCLKFYGFRAPLYSYKQYKF